jgi:alpha-beta hydrolase superfamily lysophospholipase
MVRVLVSVLLLLVLIGCGQGPGAPTQVAAPTSGMPANWTGQWTQTSIKTGDGLDLFTQAWIPAGDPRGVLVLVHGLKDHSARYGALVKALTARGVAVHTQDLRGHGRSGGERVWVDEFGQYVQDVAKVADQARAAYPGKPVFVMGHSMGGAIATLYALQQGPALAGLVLSAPALKPGKDVSGFLIGVTKFVNLLASRAKVLDLDDTKFSRDPKVVEGMRSDPLIHQPPGPARTARELLVTLELLQTDALKVAVPLLCLHGSADVVTDPDGCRNLVKQAAAKDKTLRIYDGFWHDLAHEPGGAAVVRDVAEWLVARLPDSPTATAP